MNPLEEVEHRCIIKKLIKAGAHLNLQNSYIVCMYSKLNMPGEGKGKK